MQELQVNKCVSYFLLQHDFIKLKAIIPIVLRLDKFFKVII